MNMSSFSDYILVKQSKLHGKGIFSSVFIPEGTEILKIIGEEISEGECIRRENEEDNVYIFYKDDNTYIDTKNSDKVKFINHSCDYNCLVDEDDSGNLILVAAKNISPDEELTIDYGYDDIYSNCSCNDCENKE